MYHNPPLPRPPAGFAGYRVLDAYQGADAVTRKLAMVYEVKAPDGTMGVLKPYAGVYRYHEQLDLFGAPPPAPFALTAPEYHEPRRAARRTVQGSLFSNPKSFAEWDHAQEPRANPSAKATKAIKACTDEILEALAKGTAPWCKPWSSPKVSSGGVFGALPYNGVSGKPYHGGNVPFLWGAGYKSPEWFTAKQAEKLGGSVPRGAVPVDCLFFRVLGEDEDEAGEEGTTSKSSKDDRRVVLSTFQVYNREQLDNLPTSKWAPKVAIVTDQPEKRIARAEKVMKGTGASIRHVLGDRAFYSSQTDSITLPKFNQFTTPAGYYGTAFHELGHWTGNPKRLNRRFGRKFGDDAYAFEELVAELTGAFMCAALRIDKTALEHSSYIASWMRQLKADPQVFFRAAGLAEKAFSYLYPDIGPVPEGGGDTKPTKPRPRGKAKGKAKSKGKSKSKEKPAAANVDARGARNPAVDELTPRQRSRYLAGLSGAAREARAQEIVTRRAHRSNRPFATDVGQTTRPSSHTQAFVRAFGRHASDVADAAKLTGIPQPIIAEVYARGMAAWQTGHRPGATQHAWAMARVYSFATGGPTARSADRDLAARARRNPEVLTGSVREDPQGGLYVRTWEGGGSGKRRSVKVPVPAGVATLPDWRVDLAHAPRKLRRPVGPAPQVCRDTPLAFCGDDGQVYGHAGMAGGKLVTYRWAVLPLDKLITSHDPWTLQVSKAFPAELQPRDRSRGSYQDQIRRLVAHFDPSMLFWSANVSDGAPIVGPDLVVESGNGRTMALKRVFQAEGDAREAYHKLAREWARELGVKWPAKVADPVLVRVRTSDVDRAEFARLANVAGQQQMAAAEQALADAGQMPDQMLELYDAAHGLDTGANAAFVEAFVRQVAGEQARGDLTDARGKLSAGGKDRILFALFAKAYGLGCEPLLEMTSEQTDPEIRSVLNGMQEAAPAWARFTSEIRAGRYDRKYDVTADVVQMARRIAEAKAKGLTVAALRKQADFVEPLTPVADLLAAVAHPTGTRPSAATLTAVLQGYVGRVEGMGPVQQGGMFDLPAPPAFDLMARAAASVMLEDADSAKANRVAEWLGPAATRFFPSELRPMLRNPRHAGFGAKRPRARR